MIANSSATVTPVDIMDGWVYFGINGETDNYNKASSRLNDFLAEEIIKEFGIDDALEERLVNSDDVKRYLSKYNCE